MQIPTERTGPAVAGWQPDDHPAVRRRDFALAATGAVLWGTGGLAGATLASQGVGMLAVATARLAVGGGVLLAVLLVLGRLAPLHRSRPVRRRVLVTGVLAAVYQACYFLAVEWTSVSVATLVALGAAPVLVAAATAVRSRRRPAGRTLVAVALALTGLILLLGLSTGGEPAGAALALVAAASFATMTVVNRRPVAGLGPLSLTGASFTLGAVLLAPVVIVLGHGALVPTTSGGWVLIAYLGIGPTALAYGAYFSGLRTVPATTASLLALLEPLTAALGAALLRGEQLGAGGLLGAALLAGAVLVLRPRRLSPTMGGGLP